VVTLLPYACWKNGTSPGVHSSARSYGLGARSYDTTSWSVWHVLDVFRSVPLMINRFWKKE
jgi:hypothetical protein